METTRTIRLRGVRVHNLKGIDLDLPLGRMIVFTGVSGSGKSSLAFDTLYAEGQRRYIETFSAYTRQFLETLDKPDADKLEGIPPAVAVAQGRGGSRRSGRSTVGTVTEIHDHLALLYSRLGQVVCPFDGRVVEPSSPGSVVEAIGTLAEGTRYLIAFPVEVRPDSDRLALANALREDGLTRVRTGGEVVSLGDGPLPEPARGDGGTVDVVVDRLTKGSEATSRRLDSIETAFAKGLGRCRVIADERVLTFFRGWRCASCDRTYLAPEPRLFRYNSPLGACPACEGLGRVAADPADASREGSACPDCHGARLRPEALAVRIDGRNIADVARMAVRQTRAFLGEVLEGASTVGRRVIGQASTRLDYLERIGLGYLTLDRPARTLSGGEAQRVALTSALGSGLVQTLYVLDEPSFGLHPEDVGRLVSAVHGLRDAGNTVIVVEHDETLIRAGDQVVDIGPGAGEAGGRVLYQGPPGELSAVTGSLTADFLTGRRGVAVPDRRRAPGEAWLTLQGATGHNLKNIDVAFPLGLFCVITGVSGSGKSTLVEETLYRALKRTLGKDAPTPLPFGSLSGATPLVDVTLIDASPIGRSGRSNPVTYLKAFDEVRKAFASTPEAKLRNYGPGRFSFNVEGGRCDACEGNGYLTVDMQFLPDVLIRCPECRGTRFRAETLEVTYRGKNIAEVLDLTAREAFGFFQRRPMVQARLRPLLDVGLDYLRLGQPASTLSGGEAQRLKLASHLATTPGAISRAAGRSQTLFLLDEPTTGLHPADTVKLLDAFESLLAVGHSLIVIEHSPEVMASADWLIDLGPGAGDEGGAVVAAGTPEEVARVDSPTGRVLARALARRPGG